MMQNLSSAMRASASGLKAQRVRMDVISSNIANANSVKANGREPYKRQDALLRASDNGVEISGIVTDNSPPRSVYEPGNPLADGEGNVLYSNVEPVIEMVNMISASRAYEANVAAFNSAKSMVRSALNIGKL